MKYENIVRCQFSVKRACGMHFHQDIEILYVLDGCVEVGFEDRKYFLDTEEFLLVNSNVRHEYQTDTEVLLGSLFIDYTMLTEIFNGEHLFFLCNSAEEKSESYEKMRYYIHQIFNYYQTTEGQGIVLKNSVFYQLLYIITTDFIVKKGMKQYDSLRGIQDERMNEILSYLMSNYNEPISLKELADRLYLSNAYLSKYIKRNFGMSFLKLLNNIRLEHAVSDLLYTDKTILKIAMDNGFPNIAGFNHAFREVYSMSPAEYRVQIQDKHGRQENAGSDAQIMERVEQYLSENRVGMPEVSDAVVSTLETDTRKKQPLKKNWCRLMNIGRASDLLRYDVREHIRFLKETLDFEYGRFWNLMTDSMMIRMDSTRTQYNFRLVDQVIDYLLELGIKPYIELGLKEETVFGRVEKSILEMANYNQIALIEQNKGFLEELVRHLVKRYGAGVVETWYIELEKNAVIHAHIDMETYFDVFDTVAGIFKTHVPGIKVGGAGFCLNFAGKELPEILEGWKKRKYRPDFISIYSYPYIRNEELLDAGRNPYSPDESYLYHQIREAKQAMEELQFEVPEFFVTEWSSTLSNRNRLNDGCYKSAYVMKNLIQNYGEADAVGYWMATDIYSEDIDSEKLLFGGCGLLSKDGIRKPVYFAYEHLHHLEKYILGRNQNAIVSYDGRGLFFICCHNYKHFNFRYYAQDESQVEIEYQNRLFEDNETLQMVFKIHNVNKGRYQVKIFSVNQESGNVQTEWRKLDYFNELAMHEIDYLKAICQPRLIIRQAETEGDVLEVETRLATQEIQGIVVAEL